MPKLRSGLCGTWIARRWPLGCRERRSFVGARVSTRAQTLSRHEPKRADRRHGRRNCAFRTRPICPIIEGGDGGGSLARRSAIKRRRQYGTQGRFWLVLGPLPQLPAMAADPRPNSHFGMARPVFSLNLGAARLDQALGPGGPPLGELKTIVHDTQFQSPAIRRIAGVIRAGCEPPPKPQRIEHGLAKFRRP